MYSVPWFSISSWFHPAPIPKRKRPPESWSRLATSLAVVMVSRSMIRQMPVPIFRRLVTAAAAISEMKGSNVCEYSFGERLAARERRAPAGGDVGVLRNEQRLEAALLGRARQLVGPDRIVGGEHADSEIHGSLLLLG